VTTVASSFSPPSYLKVDQASTVLQTPDEFLLFVQIQGKQVRKNGVWIVITDPDAYSSAEKTLLDEVIGLCRRKDPYISLPGHGPMVGSALTMSREELIGTHDIAEINCLGESSAIAACGLFKLVDTLDVKLLICVSAMR